MPCSEEALMWGENICIIIYEYIIIIWFYLHCFFCLSPLQNNILQKCLKEKEIFAKI